MQRRDFLEWLGSLSTVALATVGLGIRPSWVGIPSAEGAAFRLTWWEYAPGPGAHWRYCSRALRRREVYAAHGLMDLVRRYVAPGGVVAYGPLAGIQLLELR